MGLRSREGLWPITLNPKLGLGVQPHHHPLSTLQLSRVYSRPLHPKPKRKKTNNTIPIIHDHPHFAAYTLHPEQKKNNKRLGFISSVRRILFRHDLAQNTVRRLRLSEIRDPGPLKCLKRPLFLNSKVLGFRAGTLNPKPPKPTP